MFKAALFLRRFLKSNSGILLEKRSSSRILETKEDKILSKKKVTKRLYEEERKLNGMTKHEISEFKKQLKVNQNHLVFHASNIDAIYDPYKPSVAKSEFTDYDLGEMYLHQAKLKESWENGYTNFLLNHLHFIDSEYDFDDESDSLLFKTKRHQEIDLENYESRFGGEGINLQKHSKNNMNSTINQLVSHLKMNSPRQISYNKLDTDIVSLVNKIDNEYLKRFHRENYMKFQDIGKQMAQDNLLKRLSGGLTKGELGY